MYGNVRNCSSVPSYEKAAEVFAKTPQPRTKYWESHQRPLDDARKHHYRLEKFDDHYDVCLYHTIMARYYEPAPDGSRRIQYARDDRMLSKQFALSVLHLGGFTPTFNTVDGRNVIVPIGNSGSYSLGCDLHVSPTGRLDTERSTHRAICRRVVSDEVRAWRAQARGKLDAFFLFMSLRTDMLMREWQAPASSNYRNQHPGSLVRLRHRTAPTHYNLRRLGVGADLTLPQGALNMLQDMWDDAVETSLNVRDYRDDNFDKAELSVSAMVKAARATVLSRVYQLGPMGSKSIPLPMFPEAGTLPGTFSFA